MKYSTNIGDQKNLKLEKLIYELTKFIETEGLDFKIRNSPNFNASSIHPNIININRKFLQLNLPTRDIILVLAHEVGHLKLRHAHRKHPFWLSWSIKYALLVEKIVFLFEKTQEIKHELTCSTQSVNQLQNLKAIKSQLENYTQEFDFLIQESMSDFEKKYWREVEADIFAVRSVLGEISMQTAKSYFDTIVKYFPSSNYQDDLSQRREFIYKKTNILARINEYGWFDNYVNDNINLTSKFFL